MHIQFWRLARCRYATKASECAWRDLNPLPLASQTSAQSIKLQAHSKTPRPESNRRTHWRVRVMRQHRGFDDSPRSRTWTGTGLSRFPLPVGVVSHTARTGIAEPCSSRLTAGRSTASWACFELSLIKGCQARVELAISWATSRRFSRLSYWHSRDGGGRTLDRSLMRGMLFH